MWRYLRWVLLALVVLILVVAAIPFLLPTDVYKQQIIAQAREATGRDLAIDGDLKISFLPTLSVEVNNVRFANVAGAKDADMATMEQLVVGAEFWPLLSGQVKVNHLTLIKPVIHLEIDKDGKGNWLFTPPSSPAPTAGTEGDAPAPLTPPTPESAAPNTPPETFGDLQFKDVTITGGTLTYADARSGNAQRVEDINVAVKLPSLDEPMEFDGAITWNKEVLKIDAHVTNPRALSASDKTAVTARIAADVMNAAFDGEVDAGAGAVMGKIDFSTTSARRLGAWAGVNLPKVKGFGAMTLAGDMKATAKNIAFNNAKLTLDGMNGTGNVALNTAGERPKVTGDLTLDRLDLNQYSVRRAAGRPPHGPGWDDDKIDFTPLRNVDADFDFGVNAFQTGDLKFGKGIIAIKLANGRMNGTLRAISLYGGNGSGTVILDGTGPQAALSVDVVLVGLQAQAFLIDLADFDRLQGAGNFVIKVSTVGGSERQWMQSLNGATQVKFSNGSIRGVDLALIARQVQTALTGEAIGANAKTNFSELSGYFAIRNGVAANRDLKLINPYVRLFGAGIVNIGERTLDYRVEPKPTGAATRNPLSLGGIGIPFRIHGPWGNLSFDADLSGVVNSTVDSILQGNNPLDTLKDGAEGLGGLIPGLGGQQDSPNGSKKSPKKPKKQSPLDDLGNLLGGN